MPRGAGTDLGATRRAAECNFDRAGCRCGCDKDIGAKKPPGTGTVISFPAANLAPHINPGEDARCAVRFDGVLWGH